MSKLPLGCVISVKGSDAIAVVNNLSTNDIRKLPIAGVCETFVTEVHGWVVAHGMVARLMDELLLVGQFPDPESIVRHIDRYIVREDATPATRANDFAIFLMDGQDTGSRLASVFGSEVGSTNPDAITSAEFSGSQVLLIDAPIASNCSRLAIVPSPVENLFEAQLIAAGFAGSDSSDVELRRIASFWPLAGREIVEKTLPQELDRDSIAISFTKGCYLGQETVARLDARGQLQKKLGLLRVHGRVGEYRELSRDGKPAGHITSIGWDDGGDTSLALGYLKRGNGDAGTQLQCGTLPVEVLPSPQLK